MKKILPTLLVFITVVLIHLLFRGLVSKSESSFKKIIQVLTTKNTDFKNTYLVGQRFEDMEKLGLVYCSRLETVKTKRLIYDLSDSNWCRRQFILKNKKLKFDDNNGDVWQFSFYVTSELNFLIYETAILSIVILFWLIIYQFLNFKTKIALANTLSRQEAFEQIIHDINSPLQQLEKKLTPDSPVLSNINKVTAILNSYKNLHRLNSIIRVSNTIVQEINEKRVEFPQAQFNIKTEDIKSDWVSMNSVVFKRVISNLINNAIEASPLNNQLISIEISQSDNFIAIDISDAGKGISEEQIKKFGKTKFSTKGKNRGFGTTFSHEALEKVNGSLLILKTSSNGTTIRVLIPLLNAPERLIHFEDDKYIIAEWSKKSGEAKIEYHPFKSFEDFNYSNFSILKSDYFFVDKNLGEKDGIECAIFLHRKLKAKNIWLASAYIGEDVEVPDFIRGSVGKEFPFA